MRPLLEQVLLASTHRRFAARRSACQGVLGSSPERSQKCAELLSIPSGYSTLDELLNDPKVDVVHITTPNRFHFEQASRALAAGKHVLCEKPLAMNADESGRLVELARKSGLAAGVNYNIRYYRCVSKRPNAFAMAAWAKSFTWRELCTRLVVPRH